MRGRQRIAALLTLTLTAIAIPTACNSITGVSSYAATRCDECMLAHCAPAACLQEDRCKRVLDCIEDACDRTSNDVHVCINGCEPNKDAGRTPAITELLTCVRTRCRPYCLAGVPPGEPDAGDADVRTDGAPGG